MKVYLAEFLGTFILVFVGTGAIVINDVTHGAVSHVGISLTFGLVVMAMIYSVGEVSGAHLNPAVTFGFWVSGRLPGGQVAPYALSQLGGAGLASGVLRVLFPSHATLGATLPTAALAHAFVIEILLAFFLMFVILNVSTGAKKRGVMAGVAIGGIVGLGALFAGPITGASMNPARSIAPALVSSRVEHLWVYVIAPFLGAYLAMWGCRGVQAQGCCRAAQESGR